MGSRLDLGDRCSSQRHGQGYWQDNGEWEDRGDWIFESKSYRVSLSAQMKITPDEKNPTASGKNMKSGYGINEKVTSSVSGNGEHTDMQNAVTYFPEFGYKDLLAAP